MSNPLEAIRGKRGVGLCWCETSVETWSVVIVSSDDLVNAEVLAAAVLSVLLVALGTYGRRRCCHPVVRLVVLGASTLYLLLTSSIISTVKSKSTEPECGGSNSMPAAGKNKDDAQNMWTLLLWFVLIHVIKGNADMAAAAAGSTWWACWLYYSPIPLCTLSWWCAALNCLCSVLIIAGAIGVGCIYENKHVVVHPIPYKIITYSLLLAVVLVEAWEIVAGACSNWAKMALLGHYLRHESAWRRCSCVHAVLAAVLRLRPARRWRDKIGQNSVLEPRRFLKRSGLLSEKLYGRAGLTGVLSPAVKDAVLGSLLSSFGRLSSKGSGAAAARRVGGKIDWALYGSKTWSRDGGSNTELILMWHVATRLFEMKSTSTTSADMIAASHLSYYCAYLVASAPELLPDCSAWTKKRYEEVSNDVRAALGKDGHRSESTLETYERLVAALSADSRDMVLRRGAEIGRHLVKEYAEDEASACRILADFWSEMLLYVAPSDNDKGHVEAMARGGEFVTLVWALLLHAGVTTRPEAPGAAMV